MLSNVMTSKTDVKAKVIGFVGIDKYDIIIYTSLLISNLNKKVLIIDNSNSNALKLCVPIPTELNPNENRVKYKGIDYVCNMPLEKYKDKYDYIFIDYGYKTINSEVSECDSMVIVTDMQLHNIEELRSVYNVYKDTHLIVRDVLKKNNSQYVEELFKENLIINNSYIVYADDIDKKIMYSLQYGRKVKLRRLSHQSKLFLETFSTNILDIEKKDYGQAFNKLKRGA